MWPVNGECLIIWIILSYGLFWVQMFTLSSRFVVHDQTRGHKRGDRTGFPGHRSFYLICHSEPKLQWVSTQDSEQDSCRHYKNLSSQWKWLHGFQTYWKSPLGSKYSNLSQSTWLLTIYHFKLNSDAKMENNLKYLKRLLKMTLLVIIEDQH